MQQSFCARAIYKILHIGLVPSKKSTVDEKTSPGIDIKSELRLG
jgi:hypothetical protein